MMNMPELYDLVAGRHNIIKFQANKPKLRLLIREAKKSNKSYKR